MANTGPDRLRASVLAVCHSGIVATLLILSVAPANAQVTGKVDGTVTDRDTAEPLIGAQVVVVGTNLGNVTNEDGYFFINNVPVGIQEIAAHYLGYQAMSQEHRILAGQTMNVEFQLQSEVIAAEAIVAVMELEPLVARDNTVSKSRFTFEEARGLPVDDLEDVIELGAGAYESSVVDELDERGFVIRGGRITESATFVDGVLVTDFRNQFNSTKVGRFAVEEVDVITGGFSAEFGHAQSGIINIVTREGGREVHGNVRFTTDGRFDTDGYDLQTLAGGGIPDRQPCCGFHALQASIGGPIVAYRLTFFGSLDAEGAADINPRSAGFNPAIGEFNSTGSTRTILPGNRGDRTRIQAKVTSYPTLASKLTGTYLFSRDQREFHDGRFGLRQIMTDLSNRTKTHDVILGWDQQIFQGAERSLNLQLRGNFHRTAFHSGTPLNEFSAQLIRDEIGEECGAVCEAALEERDAFEADFLNFRFDDVVFFFEDAIPGGGPFGLPRSRQDPDPVFGVPRMFFSQAFFDNFTSVMERRYGMRIDLDSQLTRVHRLKLGGEWTWIDFGTRAGNLENLGGVELFEVDPQASAFYAQDRLDYGDLVIDLGLRLDHWAPNTRFPLVPGIVSCEISPLPFNCTDPADPLAHVVEGRSRTRLAPRIGVAHPITDAIQVRLSYGRFYQLPELRHYFSGLGTNSQNTGTFGNPDIDYVETTAFEAGITQLLSQGVVLDLVAYNRDRRGAIRLDIFQRGELAPDFFERRVFVNADNGNVKGVDISLTKRYANYVSADLAYSLQWARGTTSSPLEFASGFGLNLDPLDASRRLPPPTELSAESFDRTHSLNAQLNLRFPPDFRAGTLAGTIFEGFGVYLVYSAHSGEPFTRRGADRGEPLEDFNSSRLPWFHQGDIRITKAFGLGGGPAVEFFTSVINFLDMENIVFVNSTTGQPDSNGAEDLLSGVPLIPREFKLEMAPEGFPIDLDQLLEEFRDGFSRQDLNGDGTITFEEAQTRLRQALQATGLGLPGSGDHPFHYGEPRQWRFGVELRF